MHCNFIDFIGTRRDVFVFVFFPLLVSVFAKKRRGCQCQWMHSLGYLEKLIWIRYFRMGDGQNLSSVASPTIYDRFYKPQGLQGL